MMRFLFVSQSDGAMSGAQLTLGRVSSREVRWPHVTDRARASQVSHFFFVMLAISLTQLAQVAFFI